MTEASFNEWSKAIAKHVLDDPQEFGELVKKFAMCEHAASKSIAAAMAYAIAKAEEGEQKEEESAYGASQVYDEVLAEVVKINSDEHTRTDAIFTAIYYWVDKNFSDSDYDEDDYTRELLADMFKTLIVKRFVE